MLSVLAECQQCLWHYVTVVKVTFLRSEDKQELAATVEHCVQLLECDTKEDSNSHIIYFPLYSFSKPEYT